MFKESYSTVITKISPKPELIESTVNSLCRSETNVPAGRIHRRRKILIPALAALTVVAVALTLLLVPGAKVGHGFALTAAAASTDDTPSELRYDSYLAVGELGRSGSGYSPNSVTDEFYADIRVVGEGIDSVTYSMNKGKVGLSNNSRRLIGYTGKSEWIEIGGMRSRTSGTSYYDSITCAYNDPFIAEDGLRITTSCNVGDDYNASKVKRYLDMFFDEEGPGKLTVKEVKSATEAYYNEVLKDAVLNISVRYSDGSEETKSVLFSSTAEVTPVYRRFLAYATDENNNPYPVHSLTEAYKSFELRDDLDWESTPDYQSVKDIFTDEDIIGFDDYEINVILYAAVIR